ncbi:lipopolysaccharide biosynthesis protein [Caldimonas sp. KR1-144]|uniref:lipopolysaccharide biosynthesis protein n=1 Tax=Caldimonas sp. KR1-144 TaxID=3400911 RepID=UPI003C001D84
MSSQPSQRPLLSGAALNLGAKLLAVGLGLAILVAVARLGPAVQGAFALFVAVESALVTLGSGLGLLLAREVSQRRGALPAGRARRLLGAAVLFGIVAAAVLAAWAVVAQADPYRHLWLLALVAPLTLMVPTATGLWMGQGRLLALNLPLVAAPAVVLAVLLAAATLHSSTVVLVLAAWAAGKAAVGLAAGAVAWCEDRAGPAEPAPTAPREAWRFVAVIAVTNLVSLANYRATLFLVERLRGLSEAGVYSVAVQVAELLWLLSSAVTVAAYHRIGSPDAREAAALTLRAVRINLGATLAAAPLLALLAWALLPAVLGAAYAGAIVPLVLLLPGVAGYAAASSLSAYYTNHRGRPQWSAGIAGLSLAITLAVAALAVPRLGAPGAALATSAGYLLAIAVALRLFLRDAGLPAAALWRGLPERAAAGENERPASTSR